MTLLSLLFSAACLAGAAVALRAYRVGAALLVGWMGTGTVILMAFSAWRDLHPDGRLESFLLGHGLSVALLTCAAALLGSIWWLASQVTSRFTLPSTPRWGIARGASHVPLALAGVGLGVASLQLVAFAVALWMIRPVVSVYLTYVLGLRPSPRLERLVSLSRPVLIGVLVSVTVLGGAGLGWSRAPLTPPKVWRVLAFAVEARP